MACVCVLRKPTTGGRRRAAPPSTAPNAHAEGPRRPAEAGPWGAAEGPVAQLFSWARIWGLEWVRRRLPPLPPPPKKLGGEIEFLLGLLTYLQLYPDTMYQPPVGRRRLITIHFRLRLSDRGTPPFGAYAFALATWRGRSRPPSRPDRRRPARPRRARRCQPWRCAVVRARRRWRVVRLVQRVVVVVVRFALRRGRARRQPLLELRKVDAHVQVAVRRRREHRDGAWAALFPRVGFPVGAVG